MFHNAEGSISRKRGIYLGFGCSDTFVVFSQPFLCFVLFAQQLAKIGQFLVCIF
ncbi:hypothetical protein D3C81_2279250 [compost metagenome]